MNENMDYETNSNVHTDTKHAHCTRIPETVNIIDSRLKPDAAEFQPSRRTCDTKINIKQSSSPENSTTAETTKLKEMNQKDNISDTLNNAFCDYTSEKDVISDSIKDNTVIHNHLLHVSSQCEPISVHDVGTSTTVLGTQSTASQSESRTLKSVGINTTLANQSGKPVDCTSCNKHEKSIAELEAFMDQEFRHLRKKIQKSEEITQYWQNHSKRKQDACKALISKLETAFLNCRCSTVYSIMPDVHELMIKLLQS